MITYNKEINIAQEELEYIKWLVSQDWYFKGSKKLTDEEKENLYVRLDKIKF